MSLVTDVKSYADAAIEVAIGQTKQALDAAQAGLVKLQDNAKAIDPTVDTIKAAIEPYLAMAKGYGTAVSDKITSTAESVVEDLKNDKRVTQVVEGTEALAVAVVAVVQDRVGKAAAMAAANNPFAKPAGTPSKPAAAPTTTATTGSAKPVITTPVSTKPVMTKPVVTKSAATPTATPAAPLAATKPATVKTATAAKTAPARKAAPRKASSTETS